MKAVSVQLLGSQWNLVFCTRSPSARLHPVAVAVENGFRLCCICVLHSPAVSNLRFGRVVRTCALTDNSRAFVAVRDLAEGCLFQK